MDQSDEISNVAKDEIAGEVNKSLGMGENGESDQSDSTDIKENPEPEVEDLPLAAKARLGRQEKRHRKEMRALQSELAELQSRFNVTQNNVNAGAYNDSPLISNQEIPSTEDERIQRAVQFALNHKDEMQRRQKADEDMQHIQKQYKRLSDQLDNGADKYDDFDDVVRSDDAPFTSSIRDAAALFIDNPADVLYTLGKDRDKLKQISQLHPQEQIREVIKLSHALLAGAGNKKTQSNVNTLGQVKGAGVNRSQTISENTPISELRERMRNGVSWGKTRHLS